MNDDSNGDKSLENINNFTQDIDLTGSKETLMINQESSCVICLQEKFENTETLECGHNFHYECIQTWLKTAPNCPICRRQITFAESYREPVGLDLAESSGSSGLSSITELTIEPIFQNEFGNVLLYSSPLGMLIIRTENIRNDLRIISVTPLRITNSVEYPERHRSKWYQRILRFLGLLFC